MSRNLWILTEERPKNEVIDKIIQKFVQDQSIVCFIDPIRIIPILNEDNTFSFTYEVKGVDSQVINKIFIKIISGNGSFVDFLVYYQENEPSPVDIPLYGIEETKTDDTESRNTGIFQRAIKFFFLKHYYPTAKRIMLYNIKVEERPFNTPTNNFGTRCLLTLGVEFLGKKTFDTTLTPFTSVEDFIRNRRLVPPPRSGQRINVTKRGSKITISVKLTQPSGVFSDPNVGTVGLFIAVLRFLDWQHDIEIINHSLEPRHWRGRNKLTNACSLLKVNIRDARYSNLPELPQYYWQYDMSGEKHATIFLHVLVENFGTAFSIFENHAGSEKGYFYPKDGDIISVAKKIDPVTLQPRQNGISVPLPDLVLVDTDNNVIHNIEGEKFINSDNGITQLLGFDNFDDYYIKANGYDSYTIQRSVVLFGGTDTHITKVEVSFILNDLGQLILKVDSPELFIESIRKLTQYWDL